MIRPDDRVEYARHGVSWQDDGTPLPNQDEGWAPAMVLAVKEHPPLAAHLPEHERMDDDDEPDVVVTIQPDDGQPPFDLNVKLVRPSSA